MTIGLVVKSSNQLEERRASATGGLVSEDRKDPRPMHAEKLLRVFEQAVAPPRREQERAAKFVATVVEQHQR